MTRTVLLLVLTAASPLVAAETRTVTLDIPKMDCPLCPITVEAALHKVDGVDKVDVDLETRSATVTFDDTRARIEDLTTATTDSGYPSTVAP